MMMQWMHLMACSDDGHYSYDRHSEVDSAYSDFASSFACGPTRSPTAPSSARCIAEPELALVRVPVRPRDDGGMVMRSEDEIEEGVNMGSPYPGFVGRLAVGRGLLHLLLVPLVPVLVVPFGPVLMPRGRRAGRVLGVGESRR